MGIGEFALALMGAYAVMAIPIIIYEKCKSPERKDRVKHSSEYKATMERTEKCL